MYSFGAQSILAFLKFMLYLLALFGMGRLAQLVEHLVYTEQILRFFPLLILSLLKHNLQKAHSKHTSAQKPKGKSYEHNKKTIW